MDASPRCHKYFQHIQNDHIHVLEEVFGDNAEIVAYMLAGALCHAEHVHDCYVRSTFISATVSEAVNTLIRELDDQQYCKQSPLVLTAIKAYRNFAVPALGGYQTLCTFDASKSTQTQADNIAPVELRPLAKLLANIQRQLPKALILLLIAMLAAGGMFV
ncbi:hypothetical protein ACR0W7_002433 [Vibrio cholerae]|uniref:hypothetical protein n=1 Tax=Vibrio cholerae TaxID=666 RepID=UPI0008937EB8|nr:hypothetical protein [Vibrio cholerae]OFJ35989.1 hypothetical protein BFX34_01035 [Vibrio cholerae]